MDLLDLIVELLLNVIKYRKTLSIVLFSIAFFLFYLYSSNFYILTLVTWSIIVVWLFIILHKTWIDFSILSKNYSFEYKKVRRIVHSIFNFFSYDLKNEEYKYAKILIKTLLFYTFPAVLIYSILIYIKIYIPFFYYLINIFFTLSLIIFLVFLFVTKTERITLIILIVLITLFSALFSISLYSVYSDHHLNFSSSFLSNITDNINYFLGNSKSNIGKESVSKLLLVLSLISTYLLTFYFIMVVIKNNFFIYLSNLIREEINKKLIENKDKLPIFSLLVDDKVIEGKIVKIDPEECEFEIEAEDNKKHLIPWNKIKEFFGIKHAN